MGGDLTNPPKGKVPTFMIKALCDPDGAYLDRVQVIKGWLDAAVLCKKRSSTSPGPAIVSLTRRRATCR